MEYGSALVRVYGKNIDHSHFDLIGFNISIGSDYIDGLSGWNIVGENIHNNLDPDKKEHFFTLYDYYDKGNSIKKDNNNLNYHIYKYIENLNLDFLTLLFFKYLYCLRWTYIFTS